MLVPSPPDTKSLALQQHFCAASPHTSIPRALSSVRRAVLSSQAAIGWSAARHAGGTLPTRSAAAHGRQHCMFGPSGLPGQIPMYQQPGYQQPGGFAPPSGFGAPSFGGGHQAPPYHGAGGAGPAQQQRQQDDRYGGKAAKDPLLAVSRWLKARSQKERLILGVFAGILALLLLWFVVEDHDTLFILSESVHFLGIGLLAYKLIKKRAAGGLSLRTQELTAAFLCVRLFCSFMMEYDIHTLLDFLTLGATGWVIFSLRGPLKESYQSELDSTNPLFVALPCLVMAVIAHPSTRHFILFRILWAFCVYLEAVSVLPQLRMMQKAKVVEKFTAHYVFALGLSRFISCAHWILQILDGDKYLWQALGSGLWPVMVLVSEIVQTFILADFCFWYVKSYAEGTGVIHLPAGIV